MKYRSSERFQRDLEKLSKKYPTLHDDLEVAKSAAIELLHVRKIDNNSVFDCTAFKHEEVRIYKIKKFACKSLKGKGVRSGIRVIYAYYESTGEIEFLQIYFKKKQNTDMDFRNIEMYLRGLEC